MTRRRTIRAAATSAALTLLVLAAGACASGPARTAATTTSAGAPTAGTGAPTTGTPTTGAATTGAARAATTVAAPPATTARPTATTTPAPAPGTLVGPPPNATLLVESPMATRRESPANGVMVRASNPAYDRSFVLTMLAEDLARAKAAPGWTLTPLAHDPQWTPGSCGSTARTFVGHRWEVYVDAAAHQGTLDTYLLVAYDVTTGKMTSYLEQPNAVGWFTAQLFAYDDHTVGIAFDPDKLDPTGARPHTRLAVRRLDLLTGQATDAAMPAVAGNPAYDTAYFDRDGAVVAALSGGATARSGLRWMPGTTPTKVDLDTVAFSGETVDGVRFDMGAPQANGDIPLRDAAGKLLAAVHGWRVMSNGGSLGFYGWSNGRAFFGAFRDDPATVPTSSASPGVYDVATASWNWVFEPPATPDDGYGWFITGIV